MDKDPIEEKIKILNSEMQQIWSEICSKINPIDEEIEGQKREIERCEKEIKEKSYEETKTQRKFLENKIKRLQDESENDLEILQISEDIKRLKKKKSTIEDAKGIGAIRKRIKRLMMQRLQKSITKMEIKIISIKKTNGEGIGTKSQF
ncbi:MAG TPA: hypothetical protein VND01_00275 [Candidatus Acidoferrales bacterium]|nr:hypothetical protein [Candidatus Acidoferrales bacterium]